MKKIFDTLGYAREKVLLDDVLKPAGYDSSKRMVRECEAEVIKRYGAVESQESFAYILEKVHIAYDLLDNGLQQIPIDIRKSTEQCLLEYLFDRLQELADLSKEVDEFFENAN